ncbi:MAG TPA: hypothetical protein VFC46_05715, partial [Humisphaera sp.]|nr:hypothetical protein [Humisphaera sp.]
LQAQTDYDSHGSPLFELTPTAGKFEVTRLVHGKPITAPAPAGPLQVSGADADAVLVTGRGAVNSAFGWSRTYAREFGDPARGVETLKELCHATGGVFAPKGDEPFAPSRSVAVADIPRETWLIAATILLVLEILLRRIPALTALLQSRRQAASNADAS